MSGGYIKEINVDTLVENKSDIYITHHSEYIDNIVVTLEYLPPPSVRLKMSNLSTSYVHDGLLNATQPAGFLVYSCNVLL